MNKPERVKVLANEPADGAPHALACTDLDTGEGVALRYWPMHRGADGDAPNPALEMEPGKCYRVDLRFSSRKGYDDEWMVRGCEEIPDEKPPRVPTKDEYILASTCLKEAGESLRCQHSSDGSPFSETDHLKYTDALFQGMMKMLAAHCGNGEK